MEPRKQGTQTRIQARQATVPVVVLWCAWDVHLSQRKERHMLDVVWWSEVRCERRGYLRRARTTAPTATTTTARTDVRRDGKEDEDEEGGGGATLSVSASRHRVGWRHE